MTETAPGRSGLLNDLALRSVNVEAGIAPGQNGPITNALASALEAAGRP